MQDCVQIVDTGGGGGPGGQCPGAAIFGGRHFWWKEGIGNGLSRMNLKLDLGLGFRFWLRLDLPYVPAWPGLSRFKRLSRCPGLVSKMSWNFTSVKFAKLTSAWWCIVMKYFRPERLDFALTRGLGRGGAFQLWGVALFDLPRGGTSPCRGPDCVLVFPNLETTFILLDGCFPYEVVRLPFRWEQESSRKPTRIHFPQL